MPVKDLPEAGYSVSFESSDLNEENPKIEKTRDNCLRIQGPAAPQHSVSFSGGNVRFGGGSTFVGGVHVSGNSVSYGSSGIFVNGVPIQQLPQNPASNRRQLSSITVKVPKDVTARSTDCRRLRIDDVSGPVDVTQTSSSKFGGKRLGNVKVRSSGASEVMLHGVDKFNAKLSGASSLTASNIKDSSEVDVSGASSVQIDNAHGDMTLDVSGASKINANGKFTAINADVSGASKVNITGECESQPIARSSGMSSVHINGRRIDPAPNHGANIYFGQGNVSFGSGGDVFFD
jgi:hypothetical protein